MGVSPEDIDFATDLFANIGPLTTRKMMGGLCLYKDGTIFAIIHGDLGLMIKGAGAFQNDLAEMGLTRWTYQRDGAAKPTAMPYWQMPDSALDDPDVACDLARRALDYL